MWWLLLAFTLHLGAKHQGPSGRKRTQPGWTKQLAARQQISFLVPDTCQCTLESFDFSQSIDEFRLTLKELLLFILIKFTSIQINKYSFEKTSTSLVKIKIFMGNSGYYFSLLMLHLLS